MSTRYDILSAKHAYEEHCGRHRCLTGRGCPERARAWDAYMTAAVRWGLDADDDSRQRQQFTDRHADA